MIDNVDLLDEILDRVIREVDIPRCDLIFTVKSKSALTARNIIQAIALSLGISPRQIAQKFRYANTLPKGAKKYCRDRIKSGDKEFSLLFKRCCYPFNLTQITALDWPLNTKFIF